MCWWHSDHISVGLKLLVQQQLKLLTLEFASKPKKLCSHVAWHHVNHTTAQVQITYAILTFIRGCRSVVFQDKQAFKSFGRLLESLVKLTLLVSQLVQETVTAPLWHWCHHLSKAIIAELSGDCKQKKEVNPGKDVFSLWRIKIELNKHTRCDPVRSDLASLLHHAIKAEHRNSQAYFQTRCSSRLISPQLGPTLAEIPYAR